MTMAVSRKAVLQPTAKSYGSQAKPPPKRQVRRVVKRRDPHLRPRGLPAAVPAA